MQISPPMSSVIFDIWKFQYDKISVMSKDTAKCICVKQLIIKFIIIFCVSIGII